MNPTCLNQQVEQGCQSFASKRWRIGQEVFTIEQTLIGRAKNCSEEIEWRRTCWPKQQKTSLAINLALRLPSVILGDPGQSKRATVQNKRRSIGQSETTPRDCGVAYGEDVNQAHAVILAAVRSCDAVN